MGVLVYNCPSKCVIHEEGNNSYGYQIRLLMYLIFSELLKKYPMNEWMNESAICVRLNNTWRMFVYTYPLPLPPNSDKWWPVEGTFSKLYTTYFGGKNRPHYHQISSLLSSPSSKSKSTSCSRYYKHHQLDSTISGICLSMRTLFVHSMGLAQKILALW